ncbi:hypothetical protein llap_4459 [Limosa lapponica baueri]|uniref:Uncharacterized protein n=1 Tax=Limosa lapponica baueri TaxID=1758121 RepID=A0A2I0UGQ6_LIMLA|nr:hypothetical protein llap_4459 [Limosa lapponica baueri]
MLKPASGQEPTREFAIRSYRCSVLELRSLEAMITEAKQSQAVFTTVVEKCGTEAGLNVGDVGKGQSSSNRLVSEADEPEQVMKPSPSKHQVTGH